MKSIFASAALAILLAGTARAQGSLNVTTPSSAVVCEPALLQWTGGIPPYFAGNSTGPVIAQLHPQFTPAHFWVVNVKSDTPLTLKVQDIEGEIAFSDVFITQTGRTTACSDNAVQTKPSEENARSNEEKARKASMNVAFHGNDEPAPVETAEDRVPTPIEASREAAALKSVRRRATAWSTPPRSTASSDETNADDAEMTRAGPAAYLAEDKIHNGDRCRACTACQRG
ncbi:hypothetical protein BJ912DRAFT_1143498 [Pholiota molesta]|nr:hypothetical protein BJ912DRAFT_1143498 [Pholiota molesta]